MANPANKRRLDRYFKVRSSDHFYKEKDTFHPYDLLDKDYFLENMEVLKELRLPYKSIPVSVFITTSQGLDFQPHATELSTSVDNLIQAVDFIIYCDQLETDKSKE